MSILIFIAVLSVLIIIHELGHFIVARASGIKVDAFAIGFGPVILKIKFKTFDFLVCVFPLGGYVKVAGFTKQESTGRSDDFISKPIGIRACVIAFGPVFNYILSWFLFCTVFVIGFSLPSTRVGKLVEAYPAKLAGLQEGDLVLEVDGHTVHNWDEMSGFIHNLGSQNLKLSVLRGEDKLNFNIQPKREKVKDIFGKERTFSFIGIERSGELVKTNYSFPEAIKQGTLSLWELTITTIQALWCLVIGALPFRDSLTGPLGIFVITKEATRMGVSAVLHLMAVLSMSLAIFNLMPFPVLDGGHIFFLLIEKMRRKAMSSKVEEIINRVGISFIVLLVLFVLYNDVMRFGPMIVGK